MGDMTLIMCTVFQKSPYYCQNMGHTQKIAILAAELTKVPLLLCNLGPNQTYAPKK